MWEITRTVSRILHVFDHARRHSCTPAFYRPARNWKS